MGKREISKYVSDQGIKDSILEMNPAPSNLLSQQKLDDYLLKILSGSRIKGKTLQTIGH